MGSQGLHRGASLERHRMIDLIHGRPGALAWLGAIAIPDREIHAPPVRPEDLSEVGPGWALLTVHLQRRLRREGVPPVSWPRVLAIGLGEMCLALPARAPERVRQLAAATSRLALGRCEICLRGPARPLTVGEAGPPETLRLCAWHRERLAVIQRPGTLRSEAWTVLRCGTGALRALLLGARLSPGGVEAAFAQLETHLPTEPGRDRWILPDLIVHALAQVAPATLARVSADVLLPLLAVPDDEVREAAVLAMSRVQGAAPAAAPTEAPELTLDAASAAAAEHPTAAPSGPAGPTTDVAGPSSAADARLASLALSRPAYPLQIWLVDTSTGSQYTVVRDVNGAWWLGGRNTDTLRSAALPPGRLFRIERPTPWPPEIGRSLLLVADHRLLSWDPARLPGGGKRTSAVDLVAPLTWDLAVGLTSTQRRPSCPGDATGSMGPSDAPAARDLPAQPTVPTERPDPSSLATVPPAAVAPAATTVPSPADAGA